MSDVLLHDARQHSPAPVAEPGVLPTRNIMGVDVVAATTDEMIAVLDARAASGAGTKLAFLNAHGSNVAAHDAAFRAALKDFLVLNDGVGVDIAARVLHGQRFPENLNGTDFVPRFLSQTSRSLRIFLLGSAEGVAAEAGVAFTKANPRHQIVGARSGYFRDDELMEVVAGIAATRPDLVLVALGNPRQELFIHHHFAAMSTPLAMGVGALLDFTAGRVQRAPALIRRLKAEWIYRLALEPRRLWRRYVLGNFQFLWRLMWTRLIGSGAR